MLYVRSALPLCAALALTSAVGDAHAQVGANTGGDAEVTLEREPPFDHWCVAPLCGGDAHRRATLMKVPAFIAPTASDGYLEQQTKRALSDAAESAAKAMLGPAYNVALADVAEAIAATVTTDRQRLEKVGGLGAAVVRGSLAYHLDRVMPTDAACVGARRIDAIYEGLAISVAFAPLEFPQKRGRLPATCAETAKRTARAIDQAVLRTLVSEARRAQVEEAMRAIEAAKKSCADLPDATEETAARVKQAGDAMRATTVGSAAQSLQTLAAQPSPPSPPDPTSARVATPAEQACTNAIATLRSISPAPLEELVREGLAEASLAPLVESFRAPPQETLSLVVRIGTGTAGADDVRALVESLVRSTGLPLDAPVLRNAVEALPKGIVVDNGSATVDPNAILAFLASEYGVDDEGKPSLRSLVGLGTTPWVFELNGGIPSVDFSQEKFVGDLSAGYATKKFGVVGRGWIDTYNLDDSLAHNDYTHNGGSLEGWWLSGDGRPESGKVRLELRLTGGLDYYDTTTFPFKDALSQFYDFDSRMGRGTGFVGVRYGAPSDRVSLQALAGGGAQYEDPDTTKFTGRKNLSFTSEANLTLQGAMRLRMRVRVVPQIFGIRVRVDSTYFRITREQLSVTTASGAVTTTSTSEQQEQLELHGRLFFDADVASIAGFVPALFTGVDYIGISGSATSTSAAIPLLGVGIVRQSW